MRWKSKYHSREGTIVASYCPGCSCPTSRHFRLKELLRQRLVECGWRDELKKHCKEVVKSKGMEQITVEELVSEITPKGRALVPDAVKKELLQRIRGFLAQQAA